MYEKSFLMFRDWFTFSRITESAISKIKYFLNLELKLSYFYKVIAIMQFSIAFLAYFLRLDCVWKEDLDTNILSMKLFCPRKALLSMFLFQSLSSAFCPELTFIICMGH